MIDCTTNRRLMAVQILLLAEDNYADKVLNRYLAQNVPDRQARAFVTSLVYGVISRKLTLDAIIDHYCKKRLTPAIRQVLRLGIYELKYNHSVPDAVVVNECAGLPALLHQKNATGLCNAVFRNFLRETRVLNPKI